MGGKSLLENDLSCFSFAGLQHSDFSTMCGSALSWQRDIPALADKIIQNGFHLEEKNERPKNAR